MKKVLLSCIIVLVVFFVIRRRTQVMLDDADKRVKEFWEEYNFYMLFGCLDNTPEQFQGLDSSPKLCNPTT